MDADKMEEVGEPNNPVETVPRRRSLSSAATLPPQVQMDPAAEAPVSASSIARLVMESHHAVRQMLHTRNMPEGNAIVQQIDLVAQPYDPYVLEEEQADLDMADLLMAPAPQPQSVLTQNVQNPESVDHDDLLADSTALKKDMDLYLENFTMNGYNLKFTLSLIPTGGTMAPVTAAPAPVAPSLTSPTMSLGKDINLESAGINMLLGKALDGSLHNFGGTECDKACVAPRAKLYCASHDIHSVLNKMASEGSQFDPESKIFRGWDEDATSMWRVYILKRDLVKEGQMEIQIPTREGVKITKTCKINHLGLVFVNSDRNKKVIVVELAVTKNEFPTFIKSNLIIWPEVYVPDLNPEEVVETFHFELKNKVCYCYLLDKQPIPSLEIANILIQVDKELKQRYHFLVDNCIRVIESFILKGHHVINLDELRRTSKGYQIAWSCMDTCNLLNSAIYEMQSLRNAKFVLPPPHNQV